MYFSAIYTGSPGLYITIVWGPPCNIHQVTMDFFYLEGNPELNLHFATVTEMRDNPNHTIQQLFVSKWPMAEVEMWFVHQRWSSSSLED